MTKIACFNIWPSYERALEVLLLTDFRTPVGPYTAQLFCQGVLWTRERCMFSTLKDGTVPGWLRVELHYHDFILGNIPIGNDAQRAILLPFHCGEGEKVLIQRPRGAAMALNQRTFAFEPKQYALCFETGLLDSPEPLRVGDEDSAPEGRIRAELTCWCRLTFVGRYANEAVVLRAEPGFTPPGELIYGYGSC